MEWQLYRRRTSVGSFAAAAVTRLISSPGRRGSLLGERSVTSQLRASGIARSLRAEPGWRAAVLDERGSRHAFRLRASEEGSGERAPASASGASNARRSERRRFSSASDDEVGGLKARDARAAPQKTGRMG
jgi:hypothetical protein